MHGCCGKELLPTSRVPSPSCTPDLRAVRLGCSAGEASKLSRELRLCHHDVHPGIQPPCNRDIKTSQNSSRSKGVLPAQLLSSPGPVGSAAQQRRDARSPAGRWGWGGSGGLHPGSGFQAMAATFLLSGSPGAKGQWGASIHGAVVPTPLCPVSAKGRWSGICDNRPSPAGGGHGAACVLGKS